MKHVTEEEIGLFLSGRLEPGEFRKVLQHLASRCSICRRRLQRFAQAVFRPEPLPTNPPVEEAAYDAAIDRAFASALSEVPRWEEEKRQARLALESVHRHPRPGAGVAELEEDLPAGALVNTLIELSQEARFRDPREMLHFAFVAQIAARNLNPAQYGKGFTADLQMRTWAELGNAYRVNEQFDEADDAFTQADALWEQGTGDPLVLARVLDLEASFRRAQKRLPESIELLDAVHDLYEEIGEHHLAGRALVKRGINTHYDGRPREAVELLLDGIAMISSERDPQLITSAQQNLLHALVDSGKLREARRLLLESGLRQKFAKEPINLLRLRGIEAKIYLGFGKTEKAEAAFSEARESFMRLGLRYDAALAGLDLLDVWLRQGRTTEVRDLAEEILVTFEDLKVQREALRAIRYLETACRREAATPVLVQQIVGFLKRLEWEPRLQFAP